MAQDCPEHDSRLGHRESGADAASRSSAEGDPGVGAGTGVEEALGPEGERIGVELGTPVHERDVRDDHRAAPDGQPRQLKRLCCEPGGERESRAQAGEGAAVERRQLPPPHANVLGGIEVRESRGAEEEMVRRGLGQRCPEAKHAGVGGEDALDVLGIGQAQPRPRRRGHRNQEAVAEALATAREPLRGEPVLSGVDDCWPLQSGQAGAPRRSRCCSRGTEASPWTIRIRS